MKCELNDIYKALRDVEAQLNKANLSIKHLKSILNDKYDLEDEQINAFE